MKMSSRELCQLADSSLFFKKLYIKMLLHYVQNESLFNFFSSGLDPFWS